MLLAATRAGLARDGELVLPGVAIRRLLAHSDVLLAGGDGLWRSTDGGGAWQRVLPDARVRALAAGASTLYAGLKPARVLVSRDAGVSWSALGRFPHLRSWFWATPAERPFTQPAVHALAALGQTIVAGIEAGALVVSDDGGRTWSGHRRGAFRDCHDLAVAGERVFLAGYGGCAVSDDRGHRWSRLREGLDRRYGWSLAADGGDVYLFAARGPGRPGFVYRLDGARWRKVTEEVPGFAYATAADGVVHVAVGDEVWTSTDRGETWERRALGLGRVGRVLAR